MTPTPGITIDQNNHLTVTEYQSFLIGATRILGTMENTIMSGGLREVMVQVRSHTATELGETFSWTSFTTWANTYSSVLTAEWRMLAAEMGRDIYLKGTPEHRLVESVADQMNRYH
jgi:hypothetical protein